VLDGYNVSVFAYGQTGTGKTYTMQGNGDEYGIQQFMLQDLYNHKAKDQHMYDMSIGLSCLEIYNESCMDLLRSSDNKLELKMDSHSKKIVAQGLREVVCNELQEAIQCLIFAQKNRAVASTNQNQRSSRSHFIVQINVTKTFHSQGSSMDDEDEEPQDSTVTSTLYLIDLAGSEKINTSTSNPVQESETKHINKSLSALGNVMESLRKRSDVFRDKHAIVCMIPHIAPTSMCHSESSKTLQFAERMSGIALNNQ